MDSSTGWNDHPNVGHGIGTLGGRCKSAWERLRHCYGCWRRLATHFSGSSWGSVGQGSVGRGLVRLARSGTGEKSRQPGGRRPLVLDGFSSDGSRECSKSIEEQVSPREQRRWSLLPFSPSTPSCVVSLRGVALGHWSPHLIGMGRRLVLTPERLP